jgi:dTDP-4-amino-4,6-dideoxygalactose transaminase
MRTFGFTSQDYVGIADGMNAKLCEIHAAMALANLDRLEMTVVENRNRYRSYQKAMPELSGLRLLEFDESQKSSYKNIIMEVTPDWPITRDELIQILNAESILARAYYNPPLHQKLMLYPHVSTELPLTDRLAKCFISMPCGNQVTTRDIELIVNLLNFISNNGQAIQDCLHNHGGTCHVK